MVYGLKAPFGEYFRFVFVGGVEESGFGFQGGLANGAFASVVAVMIISIKTLKRAMRNHNVEKALVIVSKLIKKNPLASQLHLIKGLLLQMAEHGSRQDLRKAQSSLKMAQALDPVGIDADVELMYFYDVIIIDKKQARTLARKVKRKAEEWVTDADEILNPKN